jgi:hypothetical protein
MSKTRDIAKRVVDDPRSRLLLLLLAVATFVITFVPGWVSSNGSSGGSHGSGSTQVGVPLPSTSPNPSTTGAEPTATSRSMSTSVTMRVGYCLSAARQPTSCDVPHPYEIYRLGASCDFKSLLAYLGGVVGADTLMAAVAGHSFTVEKQPVCALNGPGASMLDGSAKQILLSSKGDGWRRCLDERDSQAVPCNRPHTSEYVFAGTVPAGSTLDCSSQASSYLDAAIANFTDELKVQKVRTSPTEACLLTIRGGDLLTASVRRIGTGALPVQPG